LSYAQENDVRRQLGRYSDAWPPPGGKPPTAADGLALADTAQGEIDAILAGRGLVTPVTAPASFVNLLRDLCAMYAGAFLVAQLFPQAAGPASTTLNEWLMRQYRAGLEDLRRGDVIPDALASTATALPRSYWTSHPFDEDGLPTTEPAFKRTTQW
jgi:hypothetical protein